MDAVVIGSGPNGLVAGATLARYGWRVLVLETQRRPGGAVYSEPLTLPGFLHDVGAAFFPFADDSPAFRFLDLQGAGLRWVNAPRESCHPAGDGVVAISRDIDQSVASFGADGPAWLKLARWQEKMGSRLAEAILAPLPALRPAWKLGVGNLLRLARIGLASPAGFSRRWFRSEAARRVIPGLALHVDLGPDDFSGAGLGLVLALLASRTGFRIPVGGAKAITEALLVRLQQFHGEIRVGTPVTGVVVRQGRAVAVRTAGGEEIPAQAILADVGPPALEKLVAGGAMSWWLRSRLKRFRYGWGTFKVDWALRGPVPWLHGEARESAVVHAGDSLADLSTFTRQVRAGRLPTRPYLVIGQQSLVDSQRAPAGEHTLWAYSHVPANPLPGGWRQHREAFADRIEQRIEGLAPGFREQIRARAVVAPPDLEAMDENLVGGDLGGGSAHFDQQLFFRPAFPYFRHDMGIRGLYLASASTHPGAGVHGACGYNAALQALQAR
jgi:phytoene dehydrogenase-like protein